MAYYWLSTPSSNTKSPANKQTIILCNPTLNPLKGDLRFISLNFANLVYLKISRIQELSGYCFFPLRTRRDLGCTHTRPSGRWPFSHLTVLNWPHCSLACTHTRPSGRGRWPSQLWPGHGRLLYIRHHVVTRHHQASTAWTIIKSAASQSFNINGQQHREHSSHLAESVTYLEPECPNG